MNGQIDWDVVEEAALEENRTRALSEIDQHHPSMIKKLDDLAKDLVPPQSPNQLRSNILQNPSLLRKKPYKDLVIDPKKQAFQDKHILKRLSARREFNKLTPYTATSNQYYHSAGELVALTCRVYCRYNHEKGGYQNTRARELIRKIDAFLRDPIKPNVFLLIVEGKLWNTDEINQLRAEAKQLRDQLESEGRRLFIGSYAEIHSFLKNL